MRPEFSATCPHCGRVNQVHECIDAEKWPRAGDVSLCWACVCPAIFTEEGGLRVPTDDEQKYIDNDPTLQVAIAARQAATRPRDAVQYLRNRGA